MKTNILLNQDDSIQIRAVLKEYQVGYTNRNLNTIDEYMKELFLNDDNIITVGTSSTEWCFGLEEVKGLIESDWNYWAALTVDIENSKINSKGNTAWFLADCSIKWPSGEDLDEWCDDLISDYFALDGQYVNYSKMTKLAMINLKLALLVKLSQSNTGEARPLPVRLSGGLIKTEGKWLINRLQFSTPMSSYPEWRIDKNNADSLKDYNAIKEKLSKFNVKLSNAFREEILETLNALQQNYLSKTANVKDTVNNLFLAYDDIYVVDPNENPAAIGSENIEKMILKQRDKWDQMVLDLNEAIISSDGDTATVITCGILKKTTCTEDFLESALYNIKETLQEDGKGEDKLFDVQKQIAYAFKELSFGEESLWEFRFEALAVKLDHQWKFHNVQITFPSLYVLEGDYKMTPLL